MYNNKINMITIFVTLLLLIGTNNAQKWNISFNETILEVVMQKTLTIPFNITASPSESDIKISTTSTNENIVTVDKPIIEKDSNNVWYGVVNITSVFIGSANLTISVIDNGIEQVSESLTIIVKRKERVIDTVFTASVATLVPILYINFGCAMDWSICHKTLKRPIGPLIGIICQFIFMPVISYVIGYLLFPTYPEMRLGIFFTGISPSGGASNIWTMLLGGNLNLSVTMTTLGTLVAFGMVPFWLFTLGRQIFQQAKLQVPYTHITALALGLIIPLALGFIIQKKCPKLCRLMIRIMKPFAVILIVFIIIFAIVINEYLFQLFSWRIIVAGLGLPWLGYIFGLLAALAFKQPNPDVRAISIETGIQNTGIAIFLLRFGLKQPAADLTTVAPVSCAIMTPIPLTVLFLIKLVLDRRKNRKAESMEKLQNPDHLINTITQSTSQTTFNQ